MELYTIETLKESLPEISRNSVNQELVDHINALKDVENISTTELEQLVDFIKETSEAYMTKETVGTREYIEACRFVFYHKRMGLSCTDSWKKVFPNKASALVRDGKSHHQSRYASVYKGRKTVQKLIKVATFDLDLYYFGERIKVINELFVMSMSESVSDKNRIEAAKAFLEQTKSTVANNTQVNVQINNMANTALENYMKSFRESSKKLQELEEISDEPIRLKNS